MNKIILINGNAIELDDGTLILCEIYVDLPKGLIGKDCLILGEEGSNNVTLSVLEYENATMFANGNNWIDGVLI